jgi:dephospho-CoA kinase
MESAPAPSTGKRWLRVGLTGGIASGKSAVAALFSAHGVPIIDADRVAREVVAPGTALLQQVFERFGAALRAGDGSLDRVALRQLVFANPELRRELERLLHPAIRRRCDELSAQAGGPYQIHVVPLLVETHGESHYDRVLVVDCPESLQIERLRARDGADAEQAQAMLSAQASREQRLAAASDVILNDGAAAALAPQVAALHQRYQALSAAPLAS